MTWSASFSGNAAAVEQELDQALNAIGAAKSAVTGMTGGRGIAVSVGGTDAGGGFTLSSSNPVIAAVAEVASPASAPPADSAAPAQADASAN